MTATIRATTFLAAACAVAACSEAAPPTPRAPTTSNATTTTATTTTAAAAPSSGAPAQGTTDGRYVVLARTRFWDKAMFDPPVEAFSLLFPQGWHVDGGVQWKGVHECRGDIVSNVVTATSPDGALTYRVSPSRSFSYADDAMMMQALQAGAQAGGCGVNEPFDAARYVEGRARKDLGAQAKNIRPDTARMAVMQERDAQANAIARQYGTGMEQTTTMAYGDLAFPDGTAGLLHVGVTNLITRRPDMLTGRTTTFSTTSVFHEAMIRFPAARRDEAVKTFATIQTSFRANPAWQQAKDAFLTKLGNVEHQGRMERLRIQAAAGQAAHEARTAASDAQQRSWESRQAADDVAHKRFIQSIREVETFVDAAGTVELSAGYDGAWSRGDGTYLLATGGFDPVQELKDSRWTKMKRVDP